MISAESNVTALVPSKDAFRNLSEAEEQFWTDYYRLPYLLQYGFCLLLQIHPIMSDPFYVQVNGTDPFQYKGICHSEIQLLEK